VDAWAGLDPIMAQAEVEEGAKLFFRKAEDNTWGVLNAREEFAKQNPQIVARVLKGCFVSINHESEQIVPGIGPQGNVAKLASETGGLLRRMQNGRVQGYAALMFAAAAILAGVFVLAI